jgi:hypothetical protein
MQMVSSEETKGMSLRGRFVVSFDGKLPDVVWQKKSDDDDGEDGHFKTGEDLIQDMELKGSQVQIDNDIPMDERTAQVMVTKRREQPRFDPALKVYVNYDTIEVLLSEIRQMKFRRVTTYTSETKRWTSPDPNVNGPVQRLFDRLEEFLDIGSYYEVDDATKTSKSAEYKSWDPSFLFLSVTLGLTIPIHGRSQPAPAPNTIKGRPPAPPLANQRVVEPDQIYFPVKYAMMCLYENIATVLITRGDDTNTGDKMKGKIQQLQIALFPGGPPSNLVQQVAGQVAVGAQNAAVQVAVGAQNEMEMAAGRAFAFSDNAATGGGVAVQAGVKKKKSNKKKSNKKVPKAQEVPPQMEMEGMAGQETADV